MKAKILALLNRALSRTSVALLGMALVSCGGGAGGDWSDFQTAQFFGAGKVTQNNDGTWTLWWPPLTQSEGVSYDVFQSTSDSTYDFEKPITNTPGNTFRSADLRLVGNTCFVVRAVQNGEKVDANKNEVCTNHEPYSFSGIKELVSLKDGTYMVRWEAPPFSGSAFQILSRKESETELKPLAISNLAFYQTAPIPLAESICFSVRHRIQEFPEDTNQEVLCTGEESAGGFSGIEEITSPAATTVKLWWRPSNRSNILKYHVYGGNTFQRRIAELIPTSACVEQEHKGSTGVWCSFEQTDLAHASSYTYGVRAVDSFEREDDNRKVKTIELINHIPEVSFVAVSSTASGSGRPESVKCTTNYHDVDAWQTLRPTFIFKNRKRAGDGDVELSRMELSPQVTEATYTLSTEDQRGDIIVCDVLIEDGFGGSKILSSAPPRGENGKGTSYLIPDTPTEMTTVYNVAASGGFSSYLYGVRNTAQEITIKPGDGYIDSDKDLATSITILSVKNGNVCVLSDPTCSVAGVGAWTTAKEIPCQAGGVCTFQFIPKLDSFTDPSTSAAFIDTRAEVEYKINIENQTVVGDITSETSYKIMGSPGATGTFYVNVRPTPRATSVYFKDGQQDETFKLSKAPGNPVIRGLFRDFTTGLGWMGYQSSLRVIKMYTRMALNAAEQASEQPNGEFDRALMDEKGINHTCRTQTLNENEIYTDCEIECRAPTEFEIDEIYGVAGNRNAAELALLKADTTLTFCPFLFKPNLGYYGSAVFYYSVADINGLKSDWARAEINFIPSLRATGHKITVVEGEAAEIKFTEQPEGSSALTGFDGSSEDVPVVGVNVKDSLINYGATRTEPLSFTCNSNTAECTASVLSVAPGGSWLGYGKASYVYQMRGIDKRNDDKEVTSNWCEQPDCITEVHFYPKARATNPTLYVLEDTPSTVGVLSGTAGGATGYFHPYGDRATELQVNNYNASMGTITEMEGSTNKSLVCNSGSCNFTVTANPDPCSGSWTGCTMTLDYSVLTRAASDSGLPANKQDIQSNMGQAQIVVRPLPVTNDLTYTIAEGTPLNLAIGNGVQTGVDTVGGYTYPITGVFAKSVQIVGAVSGGNLAGGGFSCTANPCTTIFTPAANFVGTSIIDFKVTVHDATMKQDVQSRTTGKITIIVRPAPKATGLQGSNKIIAVEGYERDFQIKYGVPPEQKGYTYAGGTKATSAQTLPVTGIVVQTSNNKEMGVISDKGGGIRFQCDADGNCGGTFAPQSAGVDWLGYGEGKFSYNVKVYDTVWQKELVSNNAMALIEVRPRPQAIGAQGTPNAPPVFITVQDTARVFSFGPGSGYTHPYNTPAKQLLIKGAQNGVASGAQCTGGICSFEFNPTVNSYGDAFVDYTVKIEDNLVQFEPFDGLIESTQTQTKVIVYPKPTASGRNVTGLQNKVTTVTLEPNTATNAFKGYSHPYSDPAHCVKVQNPRNGSIANFSCTAAGICTGQFTPTPGYYSQSPTDRAGFDYTIYIKKDGVPVDQVGVCPDGVMGLPLIASNTATVDINVRPIPVATGLTVVKKQGQSFKVSLSLGEGNGYIDLATPARMASSATFSGTASPDNAGTFGPWSCNETTGICESTFTPTGTGDTAWFGDLEIPYTVSMFDSDVNELITSDPAKLILKVRPLPIATVKDIAERQGSPAQLTLTTTPSLNPVYTHPLGYKAYRVEVRNTENGVVKLTSEVDGFSCNTTTGQCESFFRPAMVGDEFYWGNNAKFEYRVVVSDPVLASANAGDGDIESLWKAFQVDYRPVPEPTGLVSTLYVKEGSTRSVNLYWGSKVEKKGYAHGGASFHLPAHSITVTPKSGAIGTLSDFSCDQIAESCTALYTTPSSGITYGVSEFEYSVAVHDSKIGLIQSNTTNTFTIEVRPVPKASPKSVKGVQGVTKLLTLSIGNGYQYPNDLLSSLTDPKITITTSAVTNGNVSEFVCDGASGSCTANFTTNPDFYGEASFQFKVNASDPDLSTLVSNSSTYAIDYFPTPKALELRKFTDDGTLVGNHIVGIESTPKTFSFLASKIGEQGSRIFCNASDASRNLPPGYHHPYCSPGVEILIDGASLTNVTAPTNPFGCDTSGVCTGTVDPKPIGDGWFGYGLASLYYQVRIDPLELQSASLSTEEVAALTSDLARVDIEYMPVPKTKNIERWALEDWQSDYTIDKCNDTLIADCELGYVQGYNEPADKIFVSNVNQLQVLNTTCDLNGKCNISIKTNAGYSTSDFSLGSTDRASLDFKVQVKGADSNASSLKFKVYPRPMGQESTKIGVQNEELDIVLSPGQGYTHAAGGLAKYVRLDLNENGVFVNTSNCHEFDTTENTCKKYECNASGQCLIRFRGQTADAAHEDFYGAAKVWFQIELAPPAGLPETLLPGLISPWTAQSITILPKPKAENPVLVFKENEQKPFNIVPPSGYSHPLGTSATEITMLAPAHGVGYSVRDNAANHLGVIVNPSFVCSNGICSNAFTPTLNAYGAGTAQFKVTIRIGDIDLTSDNVGTMQFDIRPVPDSLVTPLAYAVEGAPYTFSIEQGHGFDHPYNVGDPSTPFPPRRISTSSLVKGTLGSWDYSTDPKVAKNTLTPEANWIPDATTNKASFEFTLSVDDPVIQASGQSAEINSAPSQKGKIEVEFRPYPRTTDKQLIGVENNDKLFALSLGNGYTHAHSLEASGIEFDNLDKITAKGFACDANGVCEGAFQPDNNFYGSASAKFRVKIVDALLPSGQQDLWSDWKDLSLDVRPLPKTSGVTLITTNRTPINFKFGTESGGGTTLAYTHPYSAENSNNEKYTTEKIIVKNLNSLHGSISGTGVSSPVTGEIHIPCGSDGNCSGTFTPVDTFTGDATFQYKVIIRDSVLDDELSSAWSAGVFKVRPTPNALSFQVFAAERKTAETRKVTLQFGSTKSGFSYNPAPGENNKEITKVSVVDNSQLNGELTAFSCSAGVCSADYSPSVGFNGAAGFTFHVFVNDDVLGELSSIDSGAVSFDVRPRPTVAVFSKSIRENISDHPDESSTQILIRLNNAGNEGYRHLYELKAFEMAVLSTSNGTASNISCNASTGDCQLDFTPTIDNFSSGDASFTYLVRVNDANLASTGNTVLESDPGTITLPVRARPRAQAITLYVPQGSSKNVSINKGLGLGYTHAELSASGISIINWDNQKLASTPSFTCTSGSCEATIAPKNTSPKPLGEASTAYQVEVFDPVLNAAIKSNTASLKLVYKGVPKVIGSPHTLYLVSGLTYQINFGKGNKYDYEDTWEPVKGSIKVSLAGASKGSFDGGVGSKEYDCNAEGQCTVNYTLSETATGTENLTYSVSVLDPDMNQALTSAQGTIVVNVRDRPILPASIPSSGTIKVFEGVNNQQIRITRVGSGMNTEAISYANYNVASLRNSLVLLASNPTNGTFSGDNAKTFSCDDTDNLVCDVSLDMPLGVHGANSFNVKARVTDTYLAAGAQEVPSLVTATVNLDVYPRPVCNNVTVYGTQGTNSVVTLQPGSSSGYTHLRNDKASNAIRVEGTNTNGDVTESNITCNGSGVCSFTFATNPPEFFTSQDGTQKSKFKFKVKVGGIESANECTAEIFTRPKPIAEPPTGLSVYEGRPITITLAKSANLGANAGYFHPYSNANGQAVEVAPGTTAGGSHVGFLCSSGSCTTTFTPITATTAGQLGAGKATIPYTVTTGTSPYNVVSESATLTMNLRPIPKIADIVGLNMIENGSLTLQLGAGHNDYVYGTADFSPQVNPLQIETKKVTGFDSNPVFSCPGSTPCTANLSTTAGFNRGANGAGRASFKYRVRVVDSVTNENVWSHSDADATWKTAEINVAPLPQATGRNNTSDSGLEGISRAIEISRGAANGYTHVQNFNAKQILVSECKNCTVTAFNCSNPGSTGKCTATLTPASNFTDISGEPKPPGENSDFNHGGKPYGWARITYNVVVNDPTFGSDITSPNSADMWVYFRPLPTTAPYSAAAPKLVTEAIEGSNYTVSLTSSAGWSYDRADSRKPNNIQIFNVQGGATATFGTCTAGNCAVTFTPPTTYPAHGLKSFDYYVKVTDPDGVVVSSQDKGTQGTGRVEFTVKALPRVQSIDQSHLVDGPGKVNGFALETCKEDGSHDTSLPTFSIGKATFNPSTGVATSTTGYFHYDGTGPNEFLVMAGTETNGRVASKPCDGATCTVKWEPRCFNAGETSMTGQFSFKIKDTFSHESKGSAATATIATIPRIKTNNVSYPKGDATQGITGITKRVYIERGGNIGYTHALNSNASSIKIVGGTGFSSPSINSTLSTCTDGQCYIDIVPTVADTNASLQFQVKDANGFISKAAGTMEVYFASKPVATTRTQTVAQGSTANLTIGLGNGYTHPNNDKATHIQIVSHNLPLAAGTSLNFTCNGSGLCTSSYTPDPTYSSPAGTPSILKYKVKIGTTLTSDDEGTYSVDIYPKPVIVDQNLYWVQGIGLWDNVTAQANRFNVVLTKGASPNAYSARGTDSANEIVDFAVTTGSGTLNSPFVCNGGGTCTGKFSPSPASYSASSGVKAVELSYKVRVIRDSVNIDSNVGKVNIFIMPNPQVKPITLDVWEDATAASFRFVNDTAGYATTPNTPKAAYNFPWLASWSKSAAYTEAPTAPVTASNFDCNFNGGGCQTYINPNSLQAGNYPFKFTLTAEAGGNWPRSVTSSEGAGTLNVKQLLDAVDFQSPTGSQFGFDQVVVPISIDRGNQWSDLRDPATGVLTAVEVASAAEGEACSGKADRLNGTLGGFTSTNGGVTWNANFTSTTGSYGYNCYRYRVKRVVGSRALYSPERTLMVYVRAEDRPAEVCDKTQAGAKYTSGTYKDHYKFVADATSPSHTTRVIAYPNQARVVKAESASCANDGWYLDPDNGATDKATKLTFTQLPTSGSISGCSSAPCNIACAADGSCTFTYNPPATTGTADFKYKVTTRNPVLANSTKESEEANGIFETMNPPTPVALPSSATVLEDNGLPIFVTAGGESPTVQPVAQWGCPTGSTTNCGLHDGPDGYPFKLNSAQVVSCNRPVFGNYPQNVICDSNGTCNTLISTYYDINGAATCTWNVTVNTVKSNNASAAFSITPVDDAPQTYGNGTNLVANTPDGEANETVHRSSRHRVCWGRQDFMATFKNTPTTVGIQGTTAANALDSGTCRYHYGYLERDGDKAVSVAVNSANQTGIANIGAFTCNANGQCTAAVTPASGFVGTAKFQYKVTTCYGGDASKCTQQTSWSWYNLEVSERDVPAVFQTGESTVAQGGAAPIIVQRAETPSGWNGVTAPPEAGYYYKNRFRDSWGHDDWWKTRFASGTLSTNLNGVSAADFTCQWSIGICIGLVKAAPGFAGTGGFDLQVVHNEGYVLSGSGNYGWGSSKDYQNELRVVSAKKTWAVNVKGVPLANGVELYSTLNAPVTVEIQQGENLGYTHLENSPASAILIREEDKQLEGGTLTEFACDTSTGKCTATFQPAVDFEGTASFKYFVTDNQEPEKYSSPSSGTVNIHIRPRAYSNDKYFGFAQERPGDSQFPAGDVADWTQQFTEGTEQNITLSRGSYPTNGAEVVWHSFDYAHIENKPATTLIASDFTNGTIGGTGVTCASGVCTVNCAADGDSNADTCKFKFMPTTGYFGNAEFNYKLTFADEPETPQKKITLGYKPRPVLSATALQVSEIQGAQTTITLDFNADTSGEYGYSHPWNWKASQINLTELTNLSTVGTPTCNSSTGTCTVVVQHSGNGLDNASFKYNVTVVGLEALAPRLVNITYAEKPVAASNKSTTTDTDTAVDVIFNQGDEYTLTSAGGASKIVVSNKLNGTTVDGNGSSTNEYQCESGTCTIRFIPNTGFSGDASFDFVVYNGDAQSLQKTYVVKVDGAPSVQAISATGGNGGVARAVAFSIGNGYTDPNNDVATSLQTQNVVNGTLSSISCDSGGLCVGTVTPDLTVTGNVTFDFKVTTVDTTRTPNVSKSSDWAVYTLATTAADEAPVATGKSISGANRTSQSVTIALNDGYTDAQNDKANAITVLSASGADVAAAACNASTGACTLTVNAQYGAFGQSVVWYSVTANGKESNPGMITLNYTSNPQTGCITGMNWTSIALSNSCGLILGATATTQNTCELSQQAGSVAGLNTGSVAANAGGMSTTLTEFPAETKPFAATWSVTSDFDDVGYLTRALKITSQTGTQLRIDDLWSAPQRSQGMTGLQAPLLGCTGDCEINNSVGEASLATMAGGAITTGTNFACASDGSGARCWGANDFGQLGNGNTTHQTYASPVDTNSLNAGIVAVSAGDEFACGLLTSGEVACWGRNDKGQLGNNSTTDSSTAVFVKRAGGARLTNIVSVSAGSNHACAVSGSKLVWCWGNGEDGALGVGTTAARSTAAPVKASGASDAANLKEVIAISSKANRTCVIQEETATRKALCWGLNTKGQLGQGTSRNIQVAVDSIDTNSEIITATNHGLADGDAVTLKDSTALPGGVTSANTIYFVDVLDTDTVKLLANTDSAASIDLSSAGNDVKLNRVYPVPTAIRNNNSTDVEGVSQISMQTLTTCVLLQNGEVRCVGDNSSGATGLNLNAGETSYASAVRNDDNSANLSTVVSLASGNSHTCALLTTGTIKCWGLNASGQLGDSSTNNAQLPVAVGTINSATGLSAGGATTCSLIRSQESGQVYGRVKCWGANTHGTLGTGSNANQTTEPTGAVKLDASTDFSARFRNCTTIYNVSDL